MEVDEGGGFGICEISHALDSLVWPDVRVLYWWALPHREHEYRGSGSTACSFLNSATFTTQ